MPFSHRDRLRRIKTFPSLVKYLRDELDWPVESEDFEDLTFEYEPEELGIDPKTAAKIDDIKQLRPFIPDQPWGIFFVKFEPKRLPVVALRRILGKLVFKKRASAKHSEQATWNLNDLLFISNYGEGEQRQINLAHFSEEPQKGHLPTLRVLGWAGEDTNLHLDHVAEELKVKLRWPDNEDDLDGWRTKWSSAFTLRHREVITTSKDLAIRLAELARDIRMRVNSILEVETEKGSLTKLMKAFREALIHDLEKDDFADMYAQTIAYGLLSARVSRPVELIPDDIADMVPITNPFLKELMQTFLDISGRKQRMVEGKLGVIDFDELGVNDVVDTLRYTNMEAVLRDFGDRNPDEDPVIHFYELFLKKYDAEKRMKRGVFYTPKPVVYFIVRSVDKILRNEFGLEDGLADTTTWGEMAMRHKKLTIPKYAKPYDPFIQILDPATGTGTFLVEVIELICQTMTGKWQYEGHSAKKIKQLWNDYVPKHLLPRLYGFELMMAPYAIAHMKISLKLFETGYRFETDQRTQIFLTNTLEPPHDSPEQLTMFAPALAHEADAGNKVKDNVPITVIIGNPPYAGVSSNRGKWITELIEDYRYIEEEPLAEKKIWVKNDYVKFLRFSQYQIQKTSLGVIGLITDHSYLDSPTFRGLRYNLLRDFNSVYIANLHGNAKRKETTPDGDIDENVFEITQGVAIGLFSKNIKSRDKREYIDIWGSKDKKYKQLIDGEFFHHESTVFYSDAPMYSFTSFDSSLVNLYNQGYAINNIFINGSNGIQTSRDRLTVAYTNEELNNRLSRLRNLNIDDEHIRDEFSVTDSSFWSLSKARKALSEDKNIKEKQKKYSYRPFDHLWLIASPAVVHRLREAVMKHCRKQNLVLCVGRAGLVLSGEWSLVYCTNNMCDHNLFYRGSSLNFPIYLYPESLFSKAKREANLSRNFTDVLTRLLNLKWTNDGSSEIVSNGSVGPENVFFYIYDQLHSKTYRQVYAEFLKMDYPRIFLTSNLNLFRNLCRFGANLVALHLLEENYEAASWNVGSGPFTKPITTFVKNSTIEVAKAHPKYEDGKVYINKACYFDGVPEEVWNFHIGGYQVCHKWLKDRGPKKGNPGRVLTDEDITHYQKIVVALNETIRLMGEIDEVIEEHGGWPDAFNL